MPSDVVPSFLIIGAAKCGTTTVYNYLKEHPQVAMCQAKEPRYFAFQDAPPDPSDPIMAESICDPETYRDAFTVNALTRATGEASPIYLAHPDAYRAIHAHNPQMKLIAVLRDPSERAFSHFLMSQRQGFEPENDFIKAIGNPVVRFGNWRRERPYIPYSKYGRDLEKFLSVFPQSQLLVLFSQELKRDPDGTLRKLTDFLEVEPLEPGAPRRDNVGYAVRQPGLERLIRQANQLGISRLMPASLKSTLRGILRKSNKTERRMTPQERRAALDLLIPDIEETERLLGDDLTTWKTINL